MIEPAPEKAKRGQHDTAEAEVRKMIVVTSFILHQSSSKIIKDVVRSDMAKTGTREA